MDCLYLCVVVLYVDLFCVYVVFVVIDWFYGWYGWWVDDYVLFVDCWVIC